MTGSEFERRLKKLAKHRNQQVRFVAAHGKGSHGRIYLGEQFTTLKDRKKQLGIGLLRAMCADLSIDPRDL